MSTPTKRSRLSIDIPAEMKRRLRLVAAQQDISLRQYVLDTIEERLAKDWMHLAEQEGLYVLNAQSDPVLADLWDNKKDDAYDDL